MLPTPVFTLWRFLLTFTVKVAELYSFINQNISIRIKSLKNKDLLLKYINALLSKDPKKQVSTLIFMNNNGFYYPFRWKYQNTWNLNAKIFDRERSHQRIIIFSWIFSFSWKLPQLSMSSSAYLRKYFFVCIWLLLLTCILRLGYPKVLSLVIILKSYL